MAIWILFSILTALVWAIGNVIDKFVFTRWTIKPIIPVIIQGGVGLIASFIIYLNYGFAELSGLNIFLGILAGIFEVLSFLFYYKAVKIEEISRVVPLYYLMNFFILIFAFIFFKETFTFAKYLGIFLLVIGAILISQKDKIDFKFNKAFWLMILAAIAYAISAIVTKYLLNFADFWTVFSYTKGIGAIVALFPIVCLNFKEISRELVKNGKKALGIILIAVLLGVLGGLFITIAVSSGSVTLANVLSSIQPFFVLVFASIISIFYPSVFKEEISKNNIIIKVVAIGLMFIGVILIT